MIPLVSSIQFSLLVGCQTPFIVNFNNQSSGQSINGYEWLINGVSVSADENLQYTFNGYGVYDVGLVVTTSTGCADTLNYADYITLAEPTINFNLPDVICTDQPVLVTNISIESVDAISTLLWDFNQDGIFDASGSNPNYSYTEPGEYNVEVAITTVSGCTNTVISETEILVQPNVVADFAASETITCAGIPVTFCTEMEESTIYAWNFDDNTGWQITSFPQDCIVHDYLDTGYFDVTL
ncbi:MAG: PKD domain-containing protein, partial [Flavobacteriales bacterium]|nr:PKD domain-containing protein [Flavobacteriales bacterium]